LELENDQPIDSKSINDMFDSSIDKNQSQQPEKKSSILKIVAILFIFVGLLIALHWIYIITAPDFVNTLTESTNLYSNMNISSEQIAGTLNFCGTFALFLSAFVLIGGILAYQRKMFWFVFIGGVIGIFALAPLFFFIPNLLSLIGVLLVVKERKEFK